ncbi:MAG: class I adenylate-forming enzyme family protein [Sagittula sp.]|uniref:class I adenylate-forming enzyme family protein n=1 Tax=Sagittula sp. TaxID=2038081 RepID=UPI004059324A
MPLAHDESCHLLPHAVAHHATYSPDKVAAVCEGETRTYGDLERRTARIGAGLARRKIGKGDKVCLFLTSSLDLYDLIWGTMRAGAVVVPLNTMLTADSLAGIVNNSGARILFTDPQYLPVVLAALPDLVHIDRDGIIVTAGPDENYRAFLGDAAAFRMPEISPEDSVSILYTSGTTGLPKGSEHSHFARMAYYVTAFGGWLSIQRDTVTVCATPLYANGTWMTLLPTFYRGGTVVILPKFSPEAFYDAVETWGGTHAFMVSTMYVQLLGAAAPDGRDLSSLRVLFSGGQQFARATYDRMRAMLPQVAFWDCYGMSEGFGTIASPADLETRPGTVGKPILLDDIRIVGDDDEECAPGDVGEFCGYGPGLMKGYHADAERTEKEIWYAPDGRPFLRSGDLGYRDAEGFFHIAGRKKDMIKSGGVNVYATDIEDVFLKHPAVLECAAIGIPHEKWLETPLLLVRLNPGQSVEPEALADWGNSRLAKYQRVSRVEFRDDFPRALYGKVRKADLRAPYWAD